MIDVHSIFFDLLEQCLLKAGAEYPSVLYLGRKSDILVVLIYQCPCLSVAEQMHKRVTEYPRYALREAEQGYQYDCLKEPATRAAT